MGMEHLDSSNSSGEVGKLRDFFENVAKAKEKEEISDSKLKSIGKDKLIPQSSSKEASVIQVKEESKQEIKKALPDSGKSLKQTEETANQMVKLAKSGKRALPLTQPPNKPPPSTPQFGQELGRLRSEIGKLDVKQEVKLERTEKTIQKEIDNIAKEIESKELSIEGYFPDLIFTQELIADIKQTIADNTEELKHERNGSVRLELKEEMDDAKIELKDELKTLKSIQEDIDEYKSEISQLKEKILVLENEIRDMK